MITGATSITFSQSENGEFRLGNLAFLIKTNWPVSDAVEEVGLATSQHAGVCSRSRNIDRDCEVRKRLTPLVQLGVCCSR